MSSITSYVQQREGELFVGESRVTLASVIANWRQGATPERIQQSFPSLPLVAIYGAITHYLENEPEMDAHFRETSAILAAHQASAEAADPDFFADLRVRLETHRALRDDEWPQLPE